MIRNLAVILLVVLAGLIILVEIIDDTPATRANGPAGGAPAPLPESTSAPTLVAQADGEAFGDPQRSRFHPLPTVAVGGVGEVTAVPDVGMIQVGVVTENEIASAALAANSQRMANLFAALSARGIAEHDVQTTNLSINPIFSRPERPRDGELQPAPRIVGYRVENRVSIKVRDLDIFGAVLDDLVTGGANTVHGIRFDVDDPQQLLDEARAAAMRDAKRKADILAAAGGFTVGRIVSVNDNAVGPLPPRPEIATFRSADAGVPIAEGELTFRVTVSVSYHIAGQSGP